MATKFEAIYEAGVLRPLEPLEMAENQRVTLEVSDPDDLLDHELMARARQDVAQLTHVPTVEGLRLLLSKDPGSWSDAVIEARADR